MTQTIDIIYFPRWLPSAKISLLTVGDHLNSNAMERYYQIFVDQMDSIYYEGYCEHMQQANPAKLEFEWKEFLSMIK